MGMRKHFFERFGSGQPQVLQERVRKYLLGMPDKHGVAFGSRVNMPDKLDQLEEERNYLLRMCPKDKHKDYDEGKETTLVRLILNTLPAEYDSTVHHVRSLMAIRNMVKGGDIDSITNLDDAVKINYDTSWLPPYKELRVGLANSWLSKKRRWDEEKGSKHKEGHPTMMVGDDGKSEWRCYGCGQQGHMRGAPECKAGKDAVWGGAPKAYLEKVKKKFGNLPMNGKRPVQEGQRQVCKFHQEGYCKYADRCHFEHEGQGGSKRPSDFNGKGKGLGKGKGYGKGKGRGKGKGKGGKGQRNSAMIVKKKVRIQDDGEGSSSIMVGEAENELYRLMRGGGYETEEEEEEVDSDPGEEDVVLEQEIEPANPPLVEESAASVWGSSSSAPEWGNNSNSSSSALGPVQSAAGSGWVPTYKHSELIGWGNSALQNAEKEISMENGNEAWRRRSEDYVRSKRNAEMEGGRSSPPKIREENLFTDGDTRPSSKPVYQTKEEKSNWGWGNDEKEEKEETLSSLFDEVNAGTFDAEKKRKRFENKYEWKGEVQYHSPYEVEEEDKDMDAMESSSSALNSSTRGGCIMGASEALNRLTKETDEDDEGNEWLIIK
jgi:hypothetical protein